MYIKRPATPPRKGYKPPTNDQVRWPSDNTIVGNPAVRFAPQLQHKKSSTALVPYLGKTSTTLIAKPVYKAPVSTTSQPSRSGVVPPGGPARR